jgi:hypothetical protein
MTEPDPLLRDLTQTARDEMARERILLDERWDRLSAGTLSAEEEAELRALAASSEEGRLALEAFRPLGDDFQDRVVRAIRAPAAKVLPFSRRAARWGGGVAAAAALAAALFLTLSHPAALPEYRAELSGGNRRQRSEINANARRFAPGSPLEIVLRPQTAVEGEVEVRFFLQGEGELRPVSLPAEIAPGGAVRISGVLGWEIAIPPGDWTVWSVVGRPGELPDEAALRARLAAGEPHNALWIALPTPLRVERQPY